MDGRVELAAAAAALIRFWGEVGDGHVHPSDDVRAYPGLATNLTPKPWMGNLKSGDVYLLYLNPGLDDIDAEWERKSRFRERVRANLSSPGDYFYLDPAFAEHPGARWARRKFGDDASSLPRDRICVLQLVAYHSTNGKPAAWAAERLASSEKMRSFANLLVARARRSEITVIVTRSQRLRGLSGITSHRNLLIYTGGQCRGAFVTKNTAGGKLLRKELGSL